MSNNPSSEMIEEGRFNEMQQTVLLIEDNSIDAHLIQAYINKMPGAPFQVIWETRLDDGISRLKKKGIDLILLDLCLPDSQDLDTLLKVQKQVSTVPIIVLTGLNDEDIAVESVKCGAQDYLVKGQTDSSLLRRSMRYAIERKRAERDIHSYQEQLRSLAAEVSLTEERERRRIAHDLHDHIGQLLVLAKMKLSSFHSTFGKQVAKPVGEINELVDNAIRYTRSLTAELSPPVLYELGLEAAILWQAEQLQMRHDIKVVVEVNDEPIQLADEMRGLLFRAVRELLHNVIKHARAHQITIRLTGQVDHILIEIIDDGTGFDTKIIDRKNCQQHGFGIFSIQERLKYIGGSLFIESEVGKGTRVLLSAPKFC